MLRQILRGIKRFVLWDYPRASWQYDVMVGLILGFIFLTPREWFRDQARIPQASHIAALPGGGGTTVFWMERELLEEVPEAERAAKASELLRQQYRTRQQLIRLEPIFDSEKEIKGYMAITKP